MSIFDGFKFWLGKALFAACAAIGFILVTMLVIWLLSKPWSKKP